MERERTEIFESITRILEQEGYVTKEESVKIMELVHERCYPKTTGRNSGTVRDID